MCASQEELEENVRKGKRSLEMSRFKEQVRALVSRDIFSKIEFHVLD